MRVLKAFFTSLIIIFVLGGGFLLVFREGLLFMTTYQIKQSLIQVRDLDKRQAYAAECGSKGSDRDEAGRVHFTQLRFLDRKRYVVEVVCNQMEHSPIEIIQESFPPFVEREIGRSGWRWGEEAAINFIALGRVWSVLVIDSQIATSYKQADLDGSLGPPAVCESFGYQCCDVNMQFGEGEAVNMAIDCPRSCFKNCEDRPLLLSFNTHPYYDKITRTLEVSSDQPVVFSYVASPNQEPSFTGYIDSDDPIEKLFAAAEVLFAGKDIDSQLEVVIDFGDGHSETFVGTRGQVEHVYRCVGSCLFETTIRIVKDGSIESYLGSQSTIKVQVN